jgi:hypothetical protein
MSTTESKKPVRKIKIIKKSKPKVSNSKILEDSFDPLDIKVQEYSDNSYGIAYTGMGLTVDGTISTSVNDFYLELFTKSGNTRSPKGFGNYALCAVLNHVVRTKKPYKLTKSGTLSLSAVNLLKTKGSQQMLERYYESLGFVRNPNKRGRYFEQSISNFLNNCKKFGNFPVLEVPAIVIDESESEAEDFAPPPARRAGTSGRRARGSRRPAKPPMQPLIGAPSPLTGAQGLDIQRTTVGGQVQFSLL